MVEEIKKEKLEEKIKNILSKSVNQYENQELKKDKAQVLRFSLLDSEKLGLDHHKFNCLTHWIYNLPSYNLSLVELNKIKETIEEKVENNNIILKIRKVEKIEDNETSEDYEVIHLKEEDEIKIVEKGMLKKGDKVVLNHKNEIKYKLKI